MADSSQKKWGDYIKWIVSQISNALKDSKIYAPVYRIVGWKKIRDNPAGLLHVQIIGKGIATYYSPLDIVNDDEMIKLFSPLDARAITILALASKENHPRYKLMLSDFSNDLDQSVFVIQDKKSDKLFRRSIDQLVHDMESIDNLSAKEAFLVGMAAGERHADRDEPIINDLKNKVNNSQAV